MSNPVQEALRKKLAASKPQPKMGRQQMFKLLRHFIAMPVAQRLEILREAGFTVTEAYTLSQTFNAFCTHIHHPGPSSEEGQPTLFRGRGRDAA